MHRKSAEDDNKEQRNNISVYLNFVVLHYVVYKTTTKCDNTEVRSQFSGVGEVIL